MSDEYYTVYRGLPAGSPASPLRPWRCDAGRPCALASRRWHQPLRSTARSSRTARVLYDANARDEGLEPPRSTVRSSKAQVSQVPSRKSEVDSQVTSHKSRHESPDKSPRGYLECHVVDAPRGQDDVGPGLEHLADPLLGHVVLPALRTPEENQGVAFGIQGLGFRIQGLATQGTVPSTSTKDAGEYNRYCTQYEVEWSSAQVITHSTVHDTSHVTVHNTVHSTVWQRRTGRGSSRAPWGRSRALGLRTASSSW